MKKIAFIGGGSGGHIMPIIAIYNFLKNDPELSFVWIGEKGAMDEAQAKEHNIPFRGIVSDKLRRYFSLRSLIAPFRIAFGFLQAISVLIGEKPDAVFSKGGPVSFPVAVAAWLLRIPLSLHESDTIPGLANRVSAKFATKIFLGFPEAVQFFDSTKTEVVGQILDPFFGQYLARTDLPKLPIWDRTRVLVSCGSLGSTIIFEKLLTIIVDFPNLDFNVILGKLNTHLRSRFADIANVTVIDWADRAQISDLYYQSDVSIMRPGATTLAETQAFGLRMIMIPLGVSSYYHQYYNAVSWSKLYQGHTVIEEKDLDTLSATLHSLEWVRKTELKKSDNLGAVEVISDYLKRGK